MAPVSGTLIGHFLGLNPVFSPRRTRQKIRDGSRSYHRSQMPLGGFEGGRSSILSRVFEGGAGTPPEREHFAGTFDQQVA